jgi:glc operon protein GlcG
MGKVTRVALGLALLVTLALSTGGTALAQAPAPISRVEQAITLDAATAMMTAAAARSRELGLAQVIVVVDASGLQKAMVRMDGARLSSITIAHDKAYTAAVRQQTTEAYGQSLLENVLLLESIAAQSHMFLTPGGLPIFVNGQIVGAIGVAGGSGPQDLDVATAGLRAIQPGQ